MLADHKSAYVIALGEHVSLVTTEHSWLGEGT